jgi:hypothetical protein
MSRIRILFISLFAVSAVSLVASAAASAFLTGPWWRHNNGSGEQVKYPLNEERQLKAKNEGNFTLVGKLLGTKVVIECSKATAKGWLWNGSLQGEDEGEEVKFESCILKNATTGECTVTVKPLKNAYSELMWKYRGEKKELEEVGQQKIYDPFGVKANEAGKFEFTSITTVAPCPVIETFPVEAVGTKQAFFDQHGVEHEIKWGSAPLVEPQNRDSTKGSLTWTMPNQTKLHHQEKEVVAKLEFAANPAELAGKLVIELNNGEEFGAFNQ